MKKAISLCSLLFSITLFAQIPAYVPLSGLLAYYPFNGNANDATINLHNGTVIGATPSADRFGNPNSAYLFNGTSNYITVPNAAPLCLSNTDFTISVWINQANLVSYEEAIISKRTTASQSGYMFNIEGPSQTIPGVTNFIVSGGFDPRAYSNTPITLNTWHHILILYTLNNQTITTYIDGAINSVVTGMPSPSGTGTSNIFIGNDAAGNPYYYHGNIDDIGMWNRALTPCEIKALYESGTNALTVTATSSIYCVTDPPGTLSANLSGGMWTGPGVSGNSFTPLTAGLGIHSIVYTYTDSLGCSSSDTLLLQVDDCVGIEPVVSEVGIVVYPNPASEKIYIDGLPEGEAYSIVITNSIGQIVLMKEVGDGEREVDVAGLNTGIYIVIVYSRGNIIVREIAVQ